MTKKSSRKKKSIKENDLNGPNLSNELLSMDINKMISDNLCKLLGSRLSMDNNEISYNQEDMKKINNYMQKNLQSESKIKYIQYESEKMMPDIIKLITKDLSEPYSIYTYRYFIHNWPELCLLAMCEDKCVGAIVCKLDMHKKLDIKLSSTRLIYRGYIAMLAIDKEFRRQKIGTNLVLQAITTMIEKGCEEVVLETEITNSSALSLYENMGFVRDKRLFRYYLNGVDAYRLKLWLK